VCRCFGLSFSGKNSLSISHNTSYTLWKSYPKNNVSYLWSIFQFCDFYRNTLSGHKIRKIPNHFANEGRAFSQIIKGFEMLCHILQLVFFGEYEFRTLIEKFNGKQVIIQHFPQFGASFFYHMKASNCICSILSNNNRSFELVHPLIYIFKYRFCDNFCMSNIWIPCIVSVDAYDVHILGLKYITSYKFVKTYQWYFKKIFVVVRHQIWISIFTVCSLSYSCATTIVTGLVSSRDRVKSTSWLQLN